MREFNGEENLYFLSRVEFPRGHFSFHYTDYPYFVAILSSTLQSEFNSVCTFQTIVVLFEYRFFPEPDSPDQPKYSMEKYVTSNYAYAKRRYRIMLLN